MILNTITYFYGFKLIKMKNKRFLVILASIIALLLIPLVAMEFTNEVVWTSSDFITMGCMLLTVGVFCELILRKITKARYRIALCILILLLFLLIWAELSVGIFGTPIAGT